MLKTILTSQIGQTSVSSSALPMLALTLAMSLCVLSQLPRPKVFGFSPLFLQFALSDLIRLVHVLDLWYFLYHAIAYFLLVSYCHMSTVSYVIIRSTSFLCSISFQESILSYLRPASPCGCIHALCFSTGQCVQAVCLN